MRIPTTWPPDTLRHGYGRCDGRTVGDPHGSMRTGCPRSISENITILPACCWHGESRVCVDGTCRHPWMRRARGHHSLYITRLTRRAGSAAVPPHAPRPTHAMRHSCVPLQIRHHWRGSQTRAAFATAVAGGSHVAQQQRSGTGSNRQRPRPAPSPPERLPQLPVQRAPSDPLGGRLAARTHPRTPIVHRRNAADMPPTTSAMTRLERHAGRPRRPPDRRGCSLTISRRSRADLGSERPVNGRWTAGGRLVNG